MTREIKSGSQILVVDDDQLTVNLLAAVLKLAGHETRLAGSGQEALDMVAQGEPDLALLDINMPGMSGLDLARRLQAETSVPFMFLSASKDNDIVKRAVEYGAIGYLVKPVDAESLLPSVEAALARAREIRQLRRTETNLTAALAAGRETSIAVGLLMATFQTDRNTAFEVMRDHARSTRRKLNEVAGELLQAAETINEFKALFARRELAPVAGEEGAGKSNLPKRN